MKRKRRTKGHRHAGRKQNTSRKAMASRRQPATGESYKGCESFWVALTQIALGNRLRRRVTMEAGR